MDSNTNPLPFAYADERRRGYRASEALPRARAKIAAEGSKPWQYQTAPRYGFERFAGHGCADAKGERWIEHADSIMRRVGFADEIAKAEGYWRSIDHTGWYTTDEGDSGEVFAGVVYQVSGSKRAPRYIAGYEHCESRGRGRDRVNMTDGARLDCSTFYDSKMEAARAADHIAEREAESERDYQAAACNGCHANELLEHVREKRREALELCAELRELKGETLTREYPAACAALREQISEAREWIETQRARISKLFEESQYRNREAFEESAGESVVAFLKHA